MPAPTHSQFVQRIAANMVTRAKDYGKHARTFQGLPAHLGFNLSAFAFTDAMRAAAMTRASEMREDAARFLADNLPRAIRADLSERGQLAPAYQLALFSPAGLDQLAAI